MREHPDGDLMQLVALHLIGGPSTNMIGIFHTTPEIIALHLGGRAKDPRAVRTAMAFLAEIGFAFYDADEETVWVPEMARFQVGERIEKPNDGRRHAVRNQLKAFSHSPFYAKFLERYGQAFKLIDPPGSPESPPTPPSKEKTRPRQDQDRTTGDPGGRGVGRGVGTNGKPADSSSMPFSSNGNEHQAHERNGPRKREKKTVAIEPGEVFTAWNAMVTGTNMPVAAKLTDTRQQEILARSADPFWLENWRAALERVRHSAFCQGSGENGWLADFDWFLQRDSVVKLIEGKFDARKKSVSSKRKPNSIPNRRPED